MYEYDTKFNTHNKLLRKFFKLDVFRTDQVETTWNTYLCMLTNCKIFVRRHEPHPYVTFEAYAFGERAAEEQRHFLRTYGHASLGKVAVVAILWKCGTIYRSLCHIRDIFQSNNYDIFELFNSVSHFPADHHLTAAIYARQRFIECFLSADKIQYPVQFQFWALVCRTVESFRWALQ